MAKRAMPELWIVRMLRNHHKLWLAIAFGVIVFAALPDGWRTISRVLVGWDLGVILYMALR